MIINKFHYRQLNDVQRKYFDATTLELRQRLNYAFRNPVLDDETSGTFGKYSKSENLYKIKYFNRINKQLQPIPFERYYYLLNVGVDSKGSFVEYVMVYDKLYDPVIRLIYILAVCALLCYFYYSYSIGAMSMVSAIALGLIVLSSIIIMFKKSNESEEECKKVDRIIAKTISEL